MNHYPNEHLIKRCKCGDRKSQRELFDSQVEPMMRVCCRYLKSLHAAEDAMLKGFMKFFASIDRFVYNGENSVEIWLRRIMVNECLMELRSSGKWMMVEEVYAEIEESQHTKILESLQADDILACVADLPDGYRTVFNLYVIEGYSHKEISDLLNINEASSRSQLSKARKHLQTLIFLKSPDDYALATK